MIKIITALTLTLILASILINCDKKNETADNRNPESTEDLIYEPTPLPQPNALQEMEITQAMLDSTFSILYTHSYPVDSSETTVDQQWTVRIQNIKLEPIYLKMRLRWHKEEGDIVHEVIKRKMNLQSQEMKEFTGIEKIIIEDPSLVKAFRAEVTIDTSEK